MRAADDRPPREGWPFRDTAAGYAGALLAVVLCGALLLAVPAMSPAAAAPMLLVVVLLVARMLGTGPALLSAAAAAAVFAYYVLPPVGQIVREVNDLVAFATFATAALVVGELAGRAERQKAEAEQGRREIEQLYEQLGQAFDRLSEAEAARRSEQVKAALLEALTHNLRTPLTGIKAAVTAMLSSGAGEALPFADRQELLRVIDEEADRLNRFIGGLSTVQPTSSSEVPATRVDDAVREALARAQTLTRRHRVRVDVPGTLPPVAVDRAALSETLFLIVDNASKYADTGTAITVGARRADGGSVDVWVEDEGPGIPEEFRIRVFDTFYRIPGRASVDPRRQGAGLGLSIARRLMESQRGLIRLRTPDTGRGTRVEVRVPVAEATGDGADPRRSDDVRGQERE